MYRANKRFWLLEHYHAVSSANKVLGYLQVDLIPLFQRCRRTALTTHCDKRRLA